MGKKRQVSLMLDEDLVKEMERVREENGIPVGRQIELKLRGYTVLKPGAVLQRYLIEVGKGVTEDYLKGCLETFGYDLVGVYKIAKDNVMLSRRQEDSRFYRIMADDDLENVRNNLKKNKSILHVAYGVLSPSSGDLEN